TLDPWSLSQKSTRKRLMWHLGVKQMLGRAAAIHYTTASEKQLAEQPLRLERGVVIPLGVDDALFGVDRAASLFRDRYPELGNCPYVLILGRLHPKKGVEAFIDVFLEAARVIGPPYWRLVVAGDGEPHYVARLKALAR